MSDPVGLEVSVIWWALVVGLVVQGFVIYAAVRLAVFHHWLMVMRRDALEDEPAEVVDLEV